MPPPRPVETVRLMLEARAARDFRRVAALMHPDIETFSPAGAALRGIDAVKEYFTGEADARRTEITAHRIEADGEDVVARGRIRFVDDETLSDSPAAWRFRVVDGLVTSIAPERA